MELFKGIAIFVGWVTSSLAGITAIFYSCGYLVTRAQLNLLGLFGLFEYPKEHYLQEGAKFFVTITVILVGSVLPKLVLSGYLLLLILLLLTPFFIYFYRKRATYAGRFDKGKSILLESFARWSWLLRGIAFFVLLCLLVFHLVGYLNSFAIALGASNLLYGSLEEMNLGGDAQTIVRWLMDGQNMELRAYFLHLLSGEIQTGFLLALAWCLAAPWPLRHWLVSPFVVLFAAYTLFTPMSYGVLVRPTKYAVVSLQSANKLLTASAGDLFLLNKDDQEFVLWDSREKRVLWIPKGEVDGAEVKVIRPLFGKHAKDFNE